MNDKEKYLELMQRYYEAETTPEEERELTSYAASTDDPDFEGLRGVLGFLSVGRQKKEGGYGQSGSMLMRPRPVWRSLPR